MVDEIEAVGQGFFYTGLALLCVRILYMIVNKRFYCTENFPYISWFVVYFGIGLSLLITTPVITSYICTDNCKRPGQGRGPEICAYVFGALSTGFAVYLFCFAFESFDFKTWPILVAPSLDYILLTVGISVWAVHDTMGPCPASC